MADREIPMNRMEVPTVRMENPMDRMEILVDNLENPTDPREIPLDRLEIPVDEKDPKWRERCSEKVVRLTRPPFVYDKDVPVPQIIINKVFKAVRDDGNVDHFVNILEEACQQTGLHLFTIWNKATPAGDSLLHVAAEFGREKIALLLAYHRPDLLIRVNNKGDTPLHVAARAKNIHAIQVILFTYVRYKYPSYNEHTSIHKEDFIRKSNKLGNTALDEAVLSKHLEGVSLLLNVHSPDYQTFYWKGHHKSPMYLAVLTGNEKILRRLLQIPFPRSETMPEIHENSPLHAAILVRNSALLQMMVDIREELMYLRDENGDTPIHYAAYTGYEKGVSILLKKSTLTAFEQNSNGNLPIHLACKRGHVQVVEDLLKLDYGPNARILLNKEGRNILHIAAMSGKNRVVKYLLRHPKIHREIVNERDVNGDTPLHLASRKLCLWTLLLLSRDKRIDVNFVNNKGLTARDIIWMHCKVPMTRQELLSDVILKGAGVPLKANKLGVRRVAFINKEWNVKDAANTLIIMATLIATVTFAAGFTVPGALYSSDDPDPKKRGMAILSHETLFKIFMAFNMIAMYSSILGSVIIIWVQLGDRHFADGVYRFAKHFVYVAITTMSVAFMAAVRLIVSNNSLLADVTIVIGSIFIFFIIFVRILGRFPLGTRLPFLRQIGELFIRFLLILFYGKNDIIIGTVVQVNQVYEDGKQHGQGDQVIEEINLNSVNSFPNSQVVQRNQMDQNDNQQGEVVEFIEDFDEIEQHYTI